MSLSIDSNNIYASDLFAPNRADRHQRQINEVGTGNSSNVESSTNRPQTFSAFSLRRQLSPEEQRRVEFLKNLLVQTLTTAQGDPSEDQKKTIREVEDELEKLTGVKMRSRISNITDKMPGKDDDEREKKKQEQQAKGIDPRETVHNNVDMITKSDNPGMQMLRNSAFYSKLSLGLDQLGEIGSTKGS